MNIELYNSDFLNFVEFNITGDNDDYKRCDVESKYLDAAVFYLVQPCFENANSTYDYFSGTKYNARKIIVLRNNLLDNLKQFQEVHDLASFITLVNSRFMGKEFLNELDGDEPQWQDKWQSINDRIVNVHRDLIEIVEKCAFEERVLWVLGY